MFARQPRSSTTATRPRPTVPPRASSRRSRRPRPLRACGAPAGDSNRAAPPTLYWIAPIPDLWPRFPPSARSGRLRDLSLLAPVGETHPGAQTRRDRSASASLRLRGGLVQSCYPQGRRGGFAAPAAAATGLCCGPRCAAIWHANAYQLTTVSRPSRRGPPQQRHADCGFPEVEGC